MGAFGSGASLPGSASAVGVAPQSGLARFLEQAKPYINYYNQGKAVYDFVKPGGSGQKGDPGQMAGDVMGAFGGNSLSDLPADVQKALMELVGKGK